MDQSLLQPTLRSNQDIRYGLSMRSQFLVGFFGGPFMVVPYLAFHSHYQGRLKRDSVLIILLAIMAGALLFGVKLTGWESENKWLGKLISRGSGLVMVGIYYLINRENQKNIESFERYKSPWVPAIVSALLGIFMSVMIAFAIKSGL
jgi:glucose-6-phosphate-specific signal transduction histidine kinase